MGIFGATLAGLLMLAEQDTIIVTTGPHGISPKYHRTEYETACGTNVFRVRFGSGPEESGRVDHLLINGRPVRDAAETLQIRAARRWIQKIRITYCDRATSGSLIRGVIEFSEGESRMLGMRWALAFRLIREGEDWRITVD